MLTITADELPLFMACNGSKFMPQFQSALPQSSITRDEGNAAHYLAKAVFSGTHTVEELTDRKAPNGVFITSEMAEHVSEYVQMLHNMLTMPDDFNDLEVDTSFGTDLFRVNARADHIYYGTLDNVLAIDDLKYGWRIVEPEMNWTLIAHAIGYCMTRQIAPARIVMTIHQPRPNHREGRVRSWSINYVELMQLYRVLAEALSNPANVLNTGNHCGICDANNHCAAASAAMYNAVDISMTRYEETISDAELAQELDLLNRAKSMLSDRLEAREELAKHRIKTGAIVKNYFLENDLTNRQWNDGVTLPMLEAITGKKLAAPAKMLSPAQVEKAGVKSEVVNLFASRRPKGVKLTRQDAQKKAERMFGK